MCESIYLMQILSNPNVARERGSKTTPEIFRSFGCVEEVVLAGLALMNLYLTLPSFFTIRLPSFLRRQKGYEIEHDFLSPFHQPTQGLRVMLK